MATKRSECLPKQQKTVAEFLTGEPLYASVSIEIKSRPHGELGYPHSIPFFCETCKSDTTWTKQTESRLWPGSLTTYGCCLCTTAKRVFLIAEDWQKQPNKLAGAPDLRPRARAMGGSPSQEHDWIVSLQKVGQWPSWSIKPPRGLSSAIGKENDKLYRKAMMCLSHGFGIGAVAYFRRIVEQTTMQILDLVEESIKAEAAADQTARLTEIEAARSQQPASERLRRAADLLPSALRPGGINPLAQLFSVYSGGLHAEDDDICISISMQYRSAFDFFFVHCHEYMRQRKEFVAQIQQPPNKTNK